MYVRWRHRVGTKRRLLEDTVSDTWYADLRESCRVDGKSITRQVAYLGSIKSEHIPWVFMRQRFWDAAKEVMDALSITKPNLLRIHASIGKVVPRPTAKETAEADKMAKELRKTFTRR